MIYTTLIIAARRLSMEALRKHIFSDRPSNKQEIRLMRIPDAIVWGIRLMKFFL